MMDSPIEQLNRIIEGCRFTVVDNNNGNEYNFYTYKGVRGRTYIKHIYRNKEIHLGYIHPSFTLNKKHFYSPHPRINMIKVVYECLSRHQVLPNQVSLFITEDIPNYQPNSDRRTRPVNDDTGEVVNMRELNDYLSRIGI